MKRFFVFVLFFILLFCDVVFAGNINRAAYRTMQYQTYRNNYMRQVNYRPIPYWQAQSNYGTRNRVYRDYQSSLNTNYSRDYRSYR